MLLALACSRPAPSDDLRARDTATLEATAPSTAAATPNSLCGDGVCDAAEQAEPNLCSRDCAAPAATAAATATAAPHVTATAAFPTASPPTSAPTPAASLFLNVSVNSNQGDLSHITGGHINLNGLEQSTQSLNDLQKLLNMRGRLVRFHYGLLWWAEDAAARSLMSSRVDWALQQGAIPLINLFAFPPSWTGCPGEGGLENCQGYPPQNLTLFRQQVSEIVGEVFLPAFAAHPQAPHIYELLNEPDVPAFWQGTRQQYLDTLTALKDGILQADPQASFAGPAAVGLGTSIQGEDSRVAEDFAQWFLGSGLDPQRLVYFTLHTYSAQVQTSLLQNLPALRQRLDALGLEAAGIVVDEWNYRIGDPALDDLTNAAFAARRLAYYADLPLAGHAFFKLADSRPDWQRAPFTARLGALNPQGLHKPVFQALTLAAMLGDTRLSVEKSGDWTERDVLAARDAAGVVTLLLVSGGGGAATPPVATVEITLNGLDDQPRQAQAYRLDAVHGNAAAFEDEIAAAYTSKWDAHLENVRQTLLGAGHPPDDVGAIIAGLQTDTQTTLSDLERENPNLYGAVIAALGAEQPSLFAALEAVADEYNRDPRLALVPQEERLEQSGGRVVLSVTLPREGVILVRLSLAG